MRKIISLSLLASAAFCVDTEINDLRLGIDFGINYTQEMTYNYFPSYINSTQEADADVLAFSLSYIRNIGSYGENGGMFVGGQIHYEKMESDNEITPAASFASETELMGIGIQTGYAYPIPSLPAMHLELGLMGSYFIGAQERRYSGNIELPQSLEGYGLSARIGGYYDLPKNFQIGVELIYVAIRKFKTGKDHTQVSVSQEEHSGLLIGLSLGMHL